MTKKTKQKSPSKKASVRRAAKASEVTAEKVLALEDAGLPVVFHSHDEAIMEVDMGRQAEAEAAATEIMTTSPAWCPDLPIGIDCKFSPHYTK